MATYCPDSRGEDSLIRLSPGVWVRPISSPEMYWELTSPGRTYSPLPSPPETENGSRFPEKTAPFSAIASASSPMGLSGSLPAPRNLALPQTAAATGSMNRKVVPLSPQSRSGFSAGTAMGLMAQPSPEKFTSAPAALRHRAVASISRERGVFSSLVGSSASAAQIISLWASDLEPMMRALPPRGPGVIILFIRPPPFPGQ